MVLVPRELYLPLRDHENTFVHIKDYSKGIVIEDTLEIVGALNDALEFMTKNPELDEDFVESLSSKDSLISSLFLTSSEEIIVMRKEKDPGATMNKMSQTGKGHGCFSAEYDHVACMVDPEMGPIPSTFKKGALLEVELSYMALNRLMFRQMRQMSLQYGIDPEFVDRYFTPSDNWLVYASSDSRAIFYGAICTKSDDSKPSSITLQTLGSGDTISNDTVNDDDLLQIKTNKNGVISLNFSYEDSEVLKFGGSF